MQAYRRKRIHVTVSIDRVTLARYSVQNNEESGKVRNMENANHPQDEDWTDKFEARVIWNLPVKHISNTSKQAKQRNTLSGGMAMDQMRTL